MTAQLSRERLEEIRDYDTCVTLEESAEMARMLLTGMNSEPVAVPDALIPCPSNNKEEVAYNSGWNACRAAMLKAGPVTGWIKCGERMPEEGGRYWCYVEEQNSLGKSHYQWNCSWNGDEWSDKAITGRVTHWMPLPAAPEQEV